MSKFYPFSIEMADYELENFSVNSKWTENSPSIRLTDKSTGFRIIAQECRNKYDNIELAFILMHLWQKYGIRYENYRFGVKYKELGEY